MVAWQSRVETVRGLTGPVGLYFSQAACFAEYLVPQDLPSCW